MKRINNGDCKNCDWYNKKLEDCAKPECCKQYNEFFKDKFKNKPFKEGDFYYTLL